MGQYHTFNLELEEKITIIKKNWDSYHFKIIKDVSDPTHDSDVAAFIMDEVFIINKIVYRNVFFLGSRSFVLCEIINYTN